MWNLIDKISYPVLIVIALFMLLAPFSPMPHIVEKLILLKNGDLRRPLDIFDLLYHAAPALVVLLKVYNDLFRRR